MKPPDRYRVSARIWPGALRRDHGATLERARISAPLQHDTLDLRLHDHDDCRWPSVGYRFWRRRYHPLVPSAVGLRARPRRYTELPSLRSRSVPMSLFPSLPEWQQVGASGVLHPLSNRAGGTLHLLLDLDGGA